MSTYYFGSQTKKRPWVKWILIILAIVILLITFINFVNQKNRQTDSIEIQRSNNFKTIESKETPKKSNIQKGVAKVDGTTKLEKQKAQQEIGPLLELDLLTPIKKIP